MAAEFQAGVAENSPDSKVEVEPVVQCHLPLDALAQLLGRVCVFYSLVYSGQPSHSTSKRWTYKLVLMAFLFPLPTSENLPFTLPWAL